MNSEPDFSAIVPAAHRVRDTFAEQVGVWKQRSFIERQWILRDFKKRAGMPVEQWLEHIDRLMALAGAKDAAGLGRFEPPVSILSDYYRHMDDLARGYTKDEDTLEAQLKSIETWIDEVDQLDRLMRPDESGQA